MTLSRNNKILLAVAVAAAALAGFWFLVLAPKRLEATRLDAKITAKQAEAAQAQQQRVTYEKARASYKADYTKLVSLGKAVPADDDVRSLMVQLDSVAGNTHVGFDKVDVGSGAGAVAPSTTTTGATVATASALAPAPGLSPIGTTGVSALPFALSFSGSFFNLSTYFDRLEAFVAVRNQHVRAKGRLLRIESIDITPGTTGWPSMTAAVGAASYVIDPIPALGAAPTSTTTPGTGTTPAPSATPPAGTTPATTTATVSGVAR
jgi:type II secretory pathway component PulM